MIRALLFFALSLICQPVFAFGSLGHQLIAELAEQRLNERSKIQIKQLLGNESIADAATYLDRMRDNPSAFWQKKAPRWHYVTAKNRYFPDSAPRHGDAYTAYVHYSQQLKNPRLSKSKRKLALYFVLHLVADLHQPLHVGNGFDKGGNTISVKFNGRRSNLHYVWDSGLLKQAGYSKTLWRKRLNHIISKNKSKNWQQALPLQWIQESIVLRKKIYPKQTSLDRRYYKKFSPMLEQRMAQASVRLAAQLNQFLN